MMISRTSKAIAASPSASTNTNPTAVTPNTSPPSTRRSARPCTPPSGAEEPEPIQHPRRQRIERIRDSKDGRGRELHPEPLHHDTDREVQRGQRERVCRRRPGGSASGSRGRERPASSARAGASSPVPCRGTSARAG
jgi:hypothetical protein